jgi:hypothetical protein
MAGECQKSPVELALFARKHRIYNRLQIVVDDLARHAAKEREGPLSANACIRLPATGCGHQAPSLAPRVDRPQQTSDG